MMPYIKFVQYIAYVMQSTLQPLSDFSSFTFLSMDLTSTRRYGPQRLQTCSLWPSVPTCGSSIAAFLTVANAGVTDLDVLAGTEPEKNTIVL